MLEAHVIGIKLESILHTEARGAFLVAIFFPLLKIMWNIESVHVKNGQLQKMGRLSNFFGLAHFLKWAAVHFLKSNAILKYLIAIFGGENLLFANFFGQLSILKNGPAQKKLDNLPIFGLAHF